MKICNHCSRTVITGDEGVVCPDCKTGFLIAVEPESDAAAAERAYRLDRSNRQHALLRRAERLETSARWLYLLAVLIFGIGGITVWQSICDSDSKPAYGCFIWSGWIALAGFLENLIAQLIFIRAALDQK